MHRVQRAIIMAAGRGERMKPVTDKIPKPLVKVNGVRMIDTVIRSLKENGIEEIYVVVGYLKEQFNVLEGVTLIENKFYDISNNISSLYVARDYLEDAIILDGDQIIYNPSILNSEFQCSGYNAVWKKKIDNEWFLEVENGKIKSCKRDGGKNGWQLYSVSRWTAEDAKKLKKHVEVQFEKRRNYQIYWDDIALFCYPNDYRLEIREMQAGDIIEIDSLSELVNIDCIYEKYL